MNFSVQRWFRGGGAALMICVTVVMSFCLVGCNRGVELGSVEGRVTKNGEPQPGLWVHFQPTEGRAAEGLTDKNGHYELKYSMNDAGALVGQHKVTIYSGGEVDSRDNQLSPRKAIYGKQVEVENGSNTIDIELE